METNLTKICGGGVDGLDFFMRDADSLYAQAWKRVRTIPNPGTHKVKEAGLAREETEESLAPESA